MMRMNRRLLTSISFALRGIPAMAVWREYEERQWWEQSKLAEYCAGLLERQLGRVSQSVPFYKSRGAGKSLASYPVLKRSEVSTAADGLIAEGSDKRASF